MIVSCSLGTVFLEVTRAVFEQKSEKADTAVRLKVTDARVKVRTRTHLCYVALIDTRTAIP